MQAVTEALGVDGNQHVWLEGHHIIHCFLQTYLQRSGEVGIVQEAPFSGKLGFWDHPSKKQQKSPGWWQPVYVLHDMCTAQLLNRIWMHPNVRKTTRSTLNSRRE